MSRVGNSSCHLLRPSMWFTKAPGGDCVPSDGQEKWGSEKVTYLSTVSQLAWNLLHTPSGFLFNPFLAEVPVAGPSGQAGMLGWIDSEPQHLSNELGSPGGSWPPVGVSRSPAPVTASDCPRRCPSKVLIASDPVVVLWDLPGSSRTWSTLSH